MQRACAVALEAHGYMPTSYAPGHPPRELLSATPKVDAPAFDEQGNPLPKNP